MLHSFSLFWMKLLHIAMTQKLERLSSSSLPLQFYVRAVKVPLVNGLPILLPIKCHRSAKERNCPSLLSRIP